MATPKRITGPARKKIVTVLSVLSRIRDEIPLAEIDGTLSLFGFQLCQEDGSPWSGFLCGRDSRATLGISTLAGEIIPETMLVTSWHRYESGRIDFNAYLS